MSNRMTSCVAAILLSAWIASDIQAAADEFSPVGRWMLLNEWGATWDVVLLDVSQNRGAFEVTFVDARPNFGALSLKNFDYREGHLSLAIQGDRFNEILFEGELKRSGPYKGEILGTVRPSIFLNPGRLRRVETQKLRPKPMPPFDGYYELLQKAAKARDVKEKAAVYMEAISKSPGPGTVFELRQWLALAETIGASEAQVREQVKPWLAAAQPYGKEFSAFARLVVLRSLRGQSQFARVSLDVANEALKNLSDLHSLEDRSSVLRFLAAAANQANRNELAVDANRQAEEIDAHLDADYEARVPPFEVESYTGREGTEEDRIVLVELFTAAVSPPCLGPNVAFDAIGSSFPSSKIVLMQYHVHQNGADALANSDSIARAEYYGCRGAPMCYFNGEATSGGAGPMELAEENYREFRWHVMQQLRSINAAEVKLSVTRTVDKLLIRSIARTDDVPGSGEPAKKNTDSESKLRLRLALTENLVRFDGGNGARMNRHVVRDFPGGVEGEPLIDGKAYVRLELDLGEVRRDLNRYLQQNAAYLAITGLRPIPPLELEHLAVVAFVQDDATKRVWHAIKIDVPERSTPEASPDGRTN